MTSPLKYCINLLSKRLDKNSGKVRAPKLCPIFRVRFPKNTKAISTRTEEEYKALKELITEDMWIFNTAEHKGSTIILKTKNGLPLEEEIYIAASITARYSKGKDEEEIAVKYKMPGKDEYIFLNVQPAYDELLKEFMI